MARVPGGIAGAGPTYTIRQLAQLWVQEGGAPSTTLYAVSVALAESGGYVDAVSPSHDYGLWQINEIHFRQFGVDAATVRLPGNNAAIAVDLSNQGYNWAPWCTAWTDPARNCGHGLLRYPQRGSYAWDKEAEVSAALGAGPAAGASNTDGRGLSDANSAWSYLQNWLSTWGPADHNTIVATTAAIARLRS